MNIRDIIPSIVLDTLRDRYLAGVADAEAVFEMHRADEDAVTGALGQSIATRDPIFFTTERGQFAAKISYRKIRGRGPGAPERVYGADGIFQIEVINSSGDIVRSKGLPFQSKTNWRGKKKDLFEQATKMQGHFGGGIVIDFTESGYRACTAQAAISARGSRPAVERERSMHALGQMLSRDFLDCTIGTTGLFFDPANEAFALQALGQGAHLISTEIVEVR